MDHAAKVVSDENVARFTFETDVVDEPIGVF